MAKKLKMELQERLREQQSFAQFKQEGSNIILRLKESLEQISEKYKQEASKVHRLEKILEDERTRAMSSGNASATDTTPFSGYGSVTHVIDLENKVQSLRKSLYRSRRELRKLRGDESGDFGLDISKESDLDMDRSIDVTCWDTFEIQRLQSKLKYERDLRIRTEEIMEDRFKQYKKIIEDEEHIIDTLREKLKHKEREMMRLKSSVQQETNSNPPVRSNSSSSLNDLYEMAEELKLDGQEVAELYTHLQSVMDHPNEERSLHVAFSSSTSVQQKMGAYHHLIRALLVKLRAEEMERLKTEEQTAEMLAEEEKTISFLEKKVKNLTSQLMRNRSIMALSESSISAFDDQIEFITQDLGEELANLDEMHELDTTQGKTMSPRDDPGGICDARSDVEPTRSSNDISAMPTDASQVIDTPTSSKNILEESQEPHSSDSNNNSNSTNISRTQKDEASSETDVDRPEIDKS